MRLVQGLRRCDIFHFSSDSGDLKKILQLLALKFFRALMTFSMETKVFNRRFEDDEGSCEFIVDHVLTSFKPLWRSNCDDSADFTIFRSISKTSK